MWYIYVVYIYVYIYVLLDRTHLDWELGLDGTWEHVARKVVEPQGEYVYVCYIAYLSAPLPPFHCELASLQAETPGIGRMPPRSLQKCMTGSHRQPATL